MLATCRSDMAQVGQLVALFDASVEDNIRMAKPTATRAEVEAAAVMAGAYRTFLDLQS